MIDRNNTGRLGAGFISVYVETRWLGHFGGFYDLEPYCTVKVVEEDEDWRQNTAIVKKQKDMATSVPHHIFLFLYNLISAQEGRNRTVAEHTCSKI